MTRRTLRRTLLWIGAGSLAVSLGLLVTPAEFQIRFRGVLFTGTGSRDLLTSPVEQLRAGGFVEDDRRSVDSLRAALREAPWGRRFDSVVAEPDPIRRAQDLVRFFSIGGYPGGRYVPYGVIAAVDSLRAGAGRCSDHVQLLESLGSAAGLRVREVQLAGHTVAEVWDGTAGRWIFIDPMYAVMARDRSGAWVGVAALVADTGFTELVPFASGPHLASPTEERYLLLYNPARTLFSEAVLVNGSATIAESGFNVRWHRLPVPARHLLGHMTGVLPGYLAIKPAATGWSGVVRAGTRALAWLVLIGVPLGLLAGAVGLAWTVVDVLGSAGASRSAPPG